MANIWLERLAPSLADSKLLRLLRENLRAQARRYGLAVTAMVLVAVTTSLVALVMSSIVDSMTDPNDRTRVFRVAGAVFAIFFVKGMATYAQTILLTRAGNRIVATQQRKLYDKLLRQGVAFFNLTESSDLLMRVTQSAQAARGIVDIFVTSFARDLLTLIGLICVMLYQQPVLTAFSLLIGPLAILGMRLILKRVRSIMEQELASLAEIIKVIQETSAGVRIIKAFALEDRMAARMNSAVGQVEQRANAISRLEAVTSPMMDTLTGLAIGSIVALSSVSFFANGGTTPGQLMSFVTALLMAYEPAKRLSRMRISIEANMVGVRMMFDMLDQPESLTEAAHAFAMPPGPGRIVFEGVTFGYARKRSAVTGLDIVFEAGRTTALVGPSGGGKSTILNLTMRLYDPDAGRLTIDGADIRHVTFGSLRSKIAFVGQETFLFSETVLENIRFGLPGATDEQVFAAAVAANAHEFILGLPKGYKTQVGENGAFLSGGQKQRLAIARAILRDAPILLLDEATSALDSRSEALVQQALERLTHGRTTVVIAHRLSTVMGADRIIVIDQGRVVETGTAPQLIAQGGIFRELHDQQFGQRPIRHVTPPPGQRVETAAISSSAT